MKKTAMILLFCSLSWAQVLQRTYQVDRCQGSAGPESCEWRLRIHTNQCSKKKPCKKLLIFFAGGLMRCRGAEITKGLGLGRILKRYASDGYVTALACYYETAREAVRPMIDQAVRTNILLKEITSNERIREVWSGEHLLYSGISHGASAPVVAMARTEFEEQAFWKGKQKTAACFYDGVYDIFGINSILLKDKKCEPLRKQSLCNRYFENEDCPKELPKLSKVVADTIVDVSPAEFGVADWKLIECGSQISGSLCRPFGDWVPKDSIVALCKRLNQSSGHRCEMDSLPRASHIGCSLDQKGIDRCRNFFNRLTSKVDVDSN